MITRIRVYFSDLWTIVTQKHSLGYRVKLLYYYSKVSAALFLDGRVLSIDSIMFMGYRVWFVSLHELFILVREIFVEEVYRTEFSKKDPVIFDCGSNIGMVVLYFKYHYPDAQITAFEPGPNSYAALKNNVEKNNLSKVILHNVALGAQKGKEVIYVRERMSLATTMVKDEMRGGIEHTIQVETLSPFITEHVDLLKIDVQLSEAAVMQELRASGVLSRIDAIQMEYHFFPGYDKNPLSSIVQIFEEETMYYVLRFNAMKVDGFTTYTVAASRSVITR